MSEFRSMTDIIKSLGFDIPFDKDGAPDIDMAESFNQDTGDLDETDGYHCDICKNKGYTAFLKDEGLVVSPCECLEIRRSIRKARKSGMDFMLSKFTFDSFIAKEEWQKQILQKAKKFTESETSRWFFIGGQVGCGKTHICTAICGELLKRGTDTLYMVWSEDAKRLKSMVNDPLYTDEINRYKNVSALYIDDFMKVRSGEEPTNGDINLAFEIINHRMLSKDKITVISSEKTLKELLSYDEALMSRIYKRCGEFNISVGKDIKKNYRLRGKK